MATRPQIDSDRKSAKSTYWFKPFGPQTRRYAECLIRCRTIIIQLFLVGIFNLGGLLIPLLFPKDSTYHLLLVPMLVAGLVLLAAALRTGWRDYLKPIVTLNDWVMSIRAGDLGARISPPKKGEFKELFPHLNSLGDMLQSLARDTELQLQRHTEHIAQKTRSLSILYDVAASINVSRDLNDLLTRFLHTLTEVVGARAAAVRLLAGDGNMKLVASIGLPQEMINRESSLPAENCLCGDAAKGSEAHLQDPLLPCWKKIGNDLFPDPHLSMLVVPLQYRGRTLGVYNLYVDGKSFQARDDTLELFTSIGRHLGMSIDKARLDEEANRLSIMEERTRIAHELHDSLAQTLASVRFQVRVLDETLHQGDEAAAWQELERIENNLDEAHTELRELIGHFRAPIPKHGLIPAIEQAVDRFRHANSGVHVFLQKEWPERALPAEHEMQVLRIIQEALVNIRKHAQADTVRVMLYGDEEGNYRILVEDDGIGIGSTSCPSTPGEHVGISIMKDRAKRIGGKLRIESEPGEGVQVILTFRYPNHVQ